MCVCRIDLPATLTGAQRCLLVAQGSRAPGEALAGHPHLPALPAGSLGTHAAGVAPRKEALGLGGRGERTRLRYRAYIG